jgi:hypothetical protein
MEEFSSETFMDVQLATSYCFADNSTLQEIFCPFRDSTPDPSFILSLGCPPYHLGIQKEWLIILFLITPNVPIEMCQNTK